MGNFSAAKAASYLRTEADGTQVYSASIDLTWSVVGNPHGGYLLAIILEASCQTQRNPASNTSSNPTNKKPVSHPDPAHLVAQFITSAKAGPAEVHVKVLRAGLSWSNVEVKLMQRQPTTHDTSSDIPPLALVITSLIMFTKLAPLPSTSPQPYSTEYQNLLPNTPSVFAHRCPLETHPALLSTSRELKPKEAARRWSNESVFWFLPASDRPDTEHILWAEDMAVRNRRLAPATPSDIKQGGRSLAWAAWCEFPQADSPDSPVIDAPTLGFFSDIFSSLPEVFGPSTNGDDSLTDERIRPHYYPTLALSMQFHAPFPSSSSSGAGSDQRQEGGGPWSWLGADRTVGVYSSGSFIHQGRHEQLVEVWSAPSRIGQGRHVAESQPDWREHCVPLITSTQLALSIDTNKLSQRMEQVSKAKASQSGTEKL